MSDNQKNFIDNISQKIKADSEELDAVTAIRLQAVRTNVLDQVSKSSNRPVILQPWFITSSVTAGVVLFSLVFFNMNSQPELNIMDDLNILSEKESFDFYQEMDFYQWLDEAERNG